jgi:hypothetical protein
MSNRRMHASTRDITTEYFKASQYQYSHDKNFLNKVKKNCYKVEYFEQVNFKDVSEHPKQL